MIFQIIQIKKMASEAKENPGKFAGGQVGELFVGMLIVPSLIALLLLGSFFILGYTSWLGGPYGFFKFLFIISVFLAVRSVDRELAVPLEIKKLKRYKLK